MFYKYNLLLSLSRMCALPRTEAWGALFSTHDPVSHCRVDTGMRAMFTTLPGKADLSSLLLWILPHKHWHTNISGAAIRFQLSGRKHENSQKLEHPPVCRQRALGFQQTPKAGKFWAWVPRQELHRQGWPPKHPLSSSTCSWDCRALGLGISRALPQWAQSPGQSAAFSLMSSLPHQRITSKSIFWREDPSRQRGTGVQWHLLQWQTGLSAPMHAASWELKMWPSLSTDHSRQPHGEWCLPGPCRGEVQTAPSFCTFARPWLTSGSPEV